MRKVVLFLIFAEISLLAVAQTSATHSDHSMSASAQEPMSGMPGMNMGVHEDQQDPFIALIQSHALSGTDVDTISTPSDMLMIMKGKWHLMLHGEAFLNELQQSGSRGGDKFFSTNWLMGMAQRRIGNGTFTFKTMLSLEPATVSGREYPLLFQQGETAFGKPIVDGQHPHDFFMELAAMYDHKIGDHALVSFYAAAMGDPALGPVAYPHRTSSSENSLAPLGHHLEDATHIAADVLTMGFAFRKFRMEASGFHGREPDEGRWNINSGKIDSWSTRITVNPSRNWSMQYSIGDLHSPESLAADEDVRRMTASITYNLPIKSGNWNSMLLWGRNENIGGGNVGNGYLLESTLRFHERNVVWTRIENVDRTTELLLGDNREPPGFDEHYFARVQAYTAGYDREIGNFNHVSAALGGQLTWYAVADVLKPIYGDHPVGVNLFLRMRLR
jgi:hypothetical protein